MKKAMMMILTLGAAVSAMAQGAAATAATAAPAAAYTGMTFKQAWEYGGWIMWVLAVLSVFALSAVFYFLFVLRQSNLMPRALVTDVLTRLRGGDVNEARRLCERSTNMFSAVVISALDCQRNLPTATAEMMRSAIEAEGSRQAESLQAQTELLLDISTIAPLLGLLGTVLGMLTAFGSVASDIASAKPVVLAAGVSQAIVTTIFGLIVAIPCMAFYAWFRRSAARRISDLEALSSEVVIALASVNK